MLTGMPGTPTRDPVDRGKTTTKNKNKQLTRQFFCWLFFFFFFQSAIESREKTVVGTAIFVSSSLSIFVSSSLYLSYHTYWAQQASVKMQTMDTIRSQPNKPVSPELHDETMSGWGFIISDEPESMSSGRQARVTVSWPTSALLTLTTAARARCWNQSPSILK